MFQLFPHSWMRAGLGGSGEGNHMFSFSLPFFIRVARNLRSVFCAAARIWLRVRGEQRL